jgi:hypothetical protein
LGHAVHLVAKKLLVNRGADLRMELGIDDICRPCSKNVEGLCVDTIDTSYRPDAPILKREWNRIIDRRWCERLGLKNGQVLSAVEMCQKLGKVKAEIVDIYREIPAPRTLERLEKLERGVRFFLAE